MSTARQHRRVVQEALLRYEGEHLDDFDVAMRCAAIGWMIQPHGTPAEQVVYLTQARALTDQVTAGHEKDGLRYLADAGLAIGQMLAMAKEESDTEEDVSAMEGFGMDFRAWAAQQRTGTPTG